MLLHANSDSEQRKHTVWLRARPFLKRLQLTRWARFRGEEDAGNPSLMDCSLEAATELLNSVPENCMELKLSEFLTPGLMRSNLHEKQLRSLAVQMTGYLGGRQCLSQLRHLGQFTTLQTLNVSKHCCTTLHLTSKKKLGFMTRSYVLD